MAVHEATWSEVRSIILTSSKLMNLNFLRIVLYEEQS